MFSVRHELNLYILVRQINLVIQKYLRRVISTQIFSVFLYLQENAQMVSTFRVATASFSRSSHDLNSSKLIYVVWKPPNYFSKLCDFALTTKPIYRSPYFKPLLFKIITYSCLCYSCQKDERTNRGNPLRKWRCFFHPRYKSVFYFPSPDFLLYFTPVSLSPPLSSIQRIKYPPRLIRSYFRRIKQFKVCTGFTVSTKHWI